MIRQLCLPMCLLALAACADVRETFYPDRSFTFERGEDTYTVDFKYHPAGFNWVARVWSVNRELTDADRDLVFDIVTRQAGPIVCGGDPLEVDEGRRLNELAGETVMYFEEIGEWRLVGSCA